MSLDEWGKVSPETLSRARVWLNDQVGNDDDLEQVSVLMVALAELEKLHAEIAEWEENGFIVLHLEGDSELPHSDLCSTCRQRRAQA